MLRTIEMKCYPTAAQAATLESWMRRCCWVYNRAMEHRIKAWKRRGESVGYNVQCKMLTGWRGRMPNIGEMPSAFGRDALRRVDRGFKAFFRRVKAGQKPGFPRFRSTDRFNSLEVLATGRRVRDDRVLVPNLGTVKVRGGKRVTTGTQKLLRIIRRASGWYAQVVVELPNPTSLPGTGESVGIDLGLASLVALSTGETIAAPRFLARSKRKLRSAQRRASRRKKGSKSRRKAVKRLRRVHELVAAQRRGFAHQLSTSLVRRFDFIAMEDLNVRGLASGMMAKSVHDAAWSTLTNQIVYKAACAGRRIVIVDPRGTSQTCPSCGKVARKDLSERVHRCSCGAVMDRDVAAAKVILSRALGVAGVSPVEESASAGGRRARRQVDPTKREVSI